MQQYFSSITALIAKNLRTILVLTIAYLLSCRVWLLFSYNLDLDGAEFTFIHYTQQLLSGKNLYLNPEAFPFSAIIYSPLYIYLHAGLCKLFNVDYLNDIHCIFIIGRILSLFFVFPSMIYLALFVKKLNGNLTGQLTAICMFLLLMTGHSYISRPDSMKIAFFLMYLYYACNFLFFDKRKIDLIFSIICALLAVASKQDALVYIILFQFVCVIYIRNWSILINSIILLILIACLFGLLQVVFGPYCLISLFNFNFQVVHKFQFTYNILVVLFTNCRLFPFYVLFVFSIFYFKDSPYNLLLKIVSTCGILSVFSSTLFLFRPGSYLNYTYELIVFAVISLIIFIHTVKYSNLIRNFIFIYFLLVFIVNPLIKNYNPFIENFSLMKKNYYTHYTLRKNIIPFLEKNEILFTPDLELSLFFVDKNIIYGHEYHLDKIIKAHLDLDCNSKLLLNSSEKYDAYFTNGAVKYILIKDKESTLAYMKKYYPVYSLLKKTDGYLLYEFTK